MTFDRYISFIPPWLSGRRSTGSGATDPGFVPGRPGRSPGKLPTGARPGMPDDLQDRNRRIGRHLGGPASRHESAARAGRQVRHAASAAHLARNATIVPRLNSRRSAPSERRVPNRRRRGLPPGLSESQARQQQSTGSANRALASSAVLIQAAWPLNDASIKSHSPSVITPRETSSFPAEVRADRRVAHETKSSVCQSHIAVVRPTRGGAAVLGPKMVAKGSPNVLAPACIAVDVAASSEDPKQVRKLSPVLGMSPTADSSRNAEACFRREV